MRAKVQKNLVAENLARRESRHVQNTTGTWSLVRGVPCGFVGSFALAHGRRTRCVFFRLATWLHDLWIPDPEPFLCRRGSIFCNHLHRSTVKKVKIARTTRRTRW
ncbi:hypothetical protein PsorP6_007986 [Peronosclerospora sorghi]|uniref:Uncharacterized protein n=1 Tax=Peronosclerospora sorghi TaxID=230839 RepID=A0ACC0WB37_9STRA|nr:hypothetical protein PsorP6_007986 [Peronosclerospora sorghi]